MGIVLSCYTTIPLGGPFVCLEIMYIPHSVSVSGFGDLGIFTYCGYSIRLAVDVGSKMESLFYYNKNFSLFWIRFRIENWKQTLRYG